MCGISGIVGYINEQKDIEIVKKLMSNQTHRGPDGQGFISDNDFVFGHNRLAIIDLDHGNQPMQTDDGLLTIVYNGEIYNYVELRQELLRKGVHFKTFSDTEVLLKLYQFEGEECLRKLNGMFAFAIFDKRSKKFIAARDHFGIKPFYYTFLPNHQLVFASEIKAFFAHPEIKAVPNNESIEQYLTFQFCLGNKTMFKGIEKLEPGKYMIWHLNGTEKQPSIKTFWEQNYEVDTYHTEEYFLDSLLILLQDSIRLQLRSDVPIGSYLSGGIDSSVVTTLAAREYGQGFQTFVGKFSEGPAYDETMYAKIVAEKSNCSLNIQVPTDQDFIELLPKLIYHMDEPVAGPGLFPQFIVSSAASKKVKVILGGQGGDELFGGYARYLVAYLEQALKGAIYQTQEEGKHIVTLNSIITGLPLLKEYVPMLKSFFQSGFFESMDRRYFRLVDRSHAMEKLLSNEMKKSYSVDRMFDSFCEMFHNPKTESYLNKMLNFDQRTLLPALLQVEDRVSMAVSIESRVPLLDHRIARLANSMPPALKFKSGRLKHVLRETMKNLLPHEILNRRDKMGFPVPLKEWLEKGLVREFLFDVLLSHKSRQRGIFNISEIENYLTNRHSFDRQIWGALCLELWYQTFIDRNG